MPLSRRKFFGMGASASAAMMLTSFETLAMEKPAFHTNQGYSLKIMGTNWGFRGTVDEFCARAKKKGMMVLKCGGQVMQQDSKSYLLP
ncbi:hypothetical protein [Paraflavitalea speifideaquila]|uniref:hypothetical protein n=1 Tax=Paraflavitalea speifideaquila TaxID=3076558 RepID=UPI0028E1EACC|nr:hypothetical protein [Paraflavitalea speifideiaquila]